MKITVLLFASLKDIVGKGQLEIEVDEKCSVESLSKKLYELYPKVESYDSSVRIALNQEFVENDIELKDGDEVAYLPPVSGG